MNIKLSQKRQTFQVRLRRQQIKDLTRVRREQLKQLEVNLLNNEQIISAQQIINKLNEAFTEGNFKLIEDGLVWITNLNGNIHKKLVQLGLLSLLSNLLEKCDEKQSLEYKIIKCLAYITNTEEIEPNLIQQTNFLERLIPIFDKKAVKSIRYAIVFYLNCCFFEKLKSKLHFPFITVIQKLQTWLQGNILQDLTAEIVCFFRCYLQFVKQDLTDTQGRSLLKYCFYIVRQKIFCFLFQSYQPKVIEDVLKIIQTLIAVPAGSVQTNAYPFKELLQIIQCSDNTLEMKKSVLLIFGQAFYQSDKLTLELVKSLPIISIIRDATIYLPVLAYEIFRNLALLSELSNDLSGICHQSAIRYILQENINLKTHIFLMLKQFAETQTQPPHSLLKIMAENTEECMIGQEVRFWGEMVLNRGYRGNVPNYVLMETDYEETYLMRKTLEIE